MEPIDLDRLAGEALGLTGRAEAFQIVCRPALAMLTADRVPIETILRNLIANAVRHHDRGSGLIELTLLDAGEDWRLIIADDGPGIPDSERAFVLEPFR
jgi:signal transduction histidine kinase